MLTALEKRAALGFIQRQRKREEEYQEECSEFARQGYGPSHCIHGTYLWVEWDVICPWCEEGLSVYEIALGHVYRLRQEMKRRREMASPMLFGTGVPIELRAAIADWCAAPIVEAADAVSTVETRKEES